jgi:signal recognition particle receptor subunit beta
VYQSLAQDQRSKLVALNTEIERTLFFDFLPLEVGEIRGFQTRFHLYTVPGQVIYDASRKLILKGLDGVVFVVDSQSDRLEENIESMKNLEKNLEQQGYNIREVPLVIQYNKRDLPNALSIRELRKHLNLYNAQEIEAVAFEGKGVLESFKMVSKNIIQILKGGAAV